MARSFFKNEISPQCSYCEHGTSTEDGGTVLCKKNGGVMQPTSKCKKYKYDPLKREPHVLTINSDFSKEDFEI